MARKPGPAKGTIRLTDQHRDKIAKSKILQRLIHHAEGVLPEGQEMSQSQVTAAIALLKKVLPDQTETKSESEVNVSVSKIVSEVVHVKN